MLSMPQFAQVEGLTIFRDDEDPTRFFYLPRRPVIAKGDDGKPMFTFLRYQFPITRGGQEPGGGYLVFTTNMIEDPGLLQTKVKPVLQQRLRSEFPTTVNLPEPVIAPVDFNGGEVRLIMMQNNQMIKAVSLGRPSLFGDNTASVAVELSADAATLFFEALRRGGSIAAIEYDLRFPIRLPAVTIIGHVDSREVRTVVMGYTNEKVTSGDTWGSESHEVAHRTSISETMHSQGLVKLEILKGDAQLSEDDMESLRAFAFRAMDDFIKAHFLKGGDIVTDEDKKSQWMTFIGDNITATFDLNVSYRDVIIREYNPSAQINPTFLGAPAESVVMEIDLQNAPWYYNTLNVTVDTNLDFAKYGDIVHSVVGHLSYDQTKPDGTRITARDSVMFTAGDRAPKKFATRIAEVGKDIFHVDVEVNFKSGPTPKAILRRFDTMVRNLTLDVPNPGVIEINFATAPKAFDGSLTAVEVEVEYGDPRNGVPQTTETVVLDKEAPAAAYRRVIYAPWDKPYRYRSTYVLKDQDGNVQRSTTQWIEASSATQYVKIPTPFDDLFSLTLIPSADWKDLREIVVDLEYDDRGSDYRVAQTFSFSKDAASAKSWKFALRNPAQRSYRYDEKWLSASGAVEERGWQTRPRDADTLLVGNAPGGVVTVEVDAADVGLGAAVRRAIVHLRYEDAPNNVLDTESLLFRDATPQQWTVARRDAKATAYTYDVEYVMSDGSRRKLEKQRGAIGGPREFLFIPAPPPA